MKSRVIFVIVVGLACVLGIVLLVINNQGSYYKYEATINTIEDITMELVSETVSSVGLEAVISDSENRGYTTSDGYWIDILVDGAWRRLRPKKEAVSTLMDYELPYKFSINWEYVYGALAEGKYRLVKTVTKDNLTYDVALEFEVGLKKDI